MRRRIIAVLLLTLVMWQGLAAADVTFKVIDGVDAKYLEKKATGIEFHTMLWFDQDTVLFLSYRGRDFLLNVDKRGAGIAVRLQ